MEEIMTVAKWNFEQGQDCLAANKDADAIKCFDGCLAENPALDIYVQGYCYLYHAITNAYQLYGRDPNSLSREERLWAIRAYLSLWRAIEGVEENGELCSAETREIVQSYQRRTYSTVVPRAFAGGNLPEYETLKTEALKGPLQCLRMPKV